MNVQLSISGLTSSFGRFFQRFHVMLFTLFAIGGLIISVYSINSALSLSSSAAELTGSQVSTRFDTKTMEEIEKLRKRDETRKPLVMPANQRTNAFEE